MVETLMKEFPDVIFVDLPQKFCDHEYCYGYKENHMIYKDVDHLNEYGSIYASNLILEAINRKKN